MANPGKADEEKWKEQKEWNEKMWAWGMFLREDILRLEEKAGITGPSLDDEKIKNKPSKPGWPKDWQGLLSKHLADIPKGAADPGDPPPPPPKDD